MPNIKDAELKEYIEERKEAYKQWLMEAQEDVSFVKSYQWDPKQARTVRKSGRPALTYNQILPIINLVAGYQRQNRQDIKVVPIEGEDDFLAEIMTLLIKNIITTNYGEYKISQMFEEGIMSSKGWIDIGIDYDDDPYNGKIELYNPSFYEMFPDPAYREYDMRRDADYCNKTVRVTKNKLLKLFPGNKSKVNQCSPDEGADISGTTVRVENPDTGYHGIVSGEESSHTKSPGRQLYSLDYVHYKEYETKQFFIDLRTGEVKDITDDKLDQNTINRLIHTVPDMAYIPRMVEVPYVAAMCSGVVIEKGISPYYPHVKGFPIIPYVCYFTPSGVTPEKKFQSIVRAAKDPQREINKRYSQALNLMNLTANAPWIVDENALSAEMKKKLQASGSTPGLIIYKKAGMEVKREYPAQAGQGHLALVGENIQSVRQVVGINPDLLGQSEKETSGKARALSMQQGIMVIQSTFDNLRYSRHILGRMLIGLIQATYSPEKVVRVCGRNKIDRQQAEQMLDEFDAREYDLEISETALSPAFRMAVQEEMTMMRDSGIIPPGIADDLIIESTDMPHKREISQRVKQYWVSQGVLPPENPAPGQNQQAVMPPQA